MLKLSAVVHTRKKGSGQEVERFIAHHPYVGTFLCCVIMPILVLTAVIAVCYAMMLPISFFMGWL